MSRTILETLFVSALAAAVTFPAACSSHAGQEGVGSGKEAPFEFSTSTNDATFHFTSFPDLFNWNIKYPQPGWEDAMDWFLAGMKKEGPRVLAPRRRHHGRPLVDQPGGGPARDTKVLGRVQEAIRG